MSLHDRLNPAAGIAEVYDRPAMAMQALARRLFIFDGFVLFLGRLSDTSPHAHYALQVALGLGAPFSLTSAHATREYEAALVPSNVEHQLSVPSEGVALLYIDPTTREGDVITAQLPSREVHSVDADLADVTAHARGMFVHGATPRAADDLRVAVLGCLLPGSLSSTAIDARVHRAVELLGTSDADEWDTTRLAKEVALSPDRLRHLFRDQVGIPIRSYKLWSRLRRAAALLATGTSVTEIAHASGFADSAHLSRTFRQMFGVAPSELLSSSAITKVD